MRLPTERLVLGFGVAIAAATYAYWTWELPQLSALPAARAGFGLAAVLLLALVLRAIRAVDERGGGPEP